MPKSASDSPSLAPSRKFDRDMQIPPETGRHRLRRQPRRFRLVGPYGQNLALVERRLGVVVDPAATTSPSQAPATAATRARVLKRCMRRPQGTTSRRARSKARSARARAGFAVRIRSQDRQGLVRDHQPAQASGARPHGRAGFLYPRAEAPRDGYSASARPAPARPGLQWRMPRNCSNARKSIRIILSRPAVEAGERLGFLPGDLREKRSIPT